MVWFDPACTPAGMPGNCTTRARSTIPTAVARVAGYSFDAVVMMGWGRGDWRVQGRNAINGTGVCRIFDWRGPTWRPFF